MIDPKQFSIEQYKQLRDEIIQYVREIFQTEIYGGIAVASVYTWLLSHKHDLLVRAVWFIPPCLILIGAVHCLMLTFRIKHIGRFLKHLEQAAYGQHAKSFGWEHYKTDAHHWVDTTDEVIATIAWALVFVGSVLISYLFLK
jgi:hypothetical protein